jgi:hypothetical protein
MNQMNEISRDPDNLLILAVTFNYSIFCNKN